MREPKSFAAKERAHLFSGRVLLPLRVRVWMATWTFCAEDAFTTDHWKRFHVGDRRLPMLRGGTESCPACCSRHMGSEP